jgi:hypothetical protein
MKFQNNSLAQKNFSLYSKTLAEFLYNLVEYEINGIPRPNSDPDPKIPSDGFYPKWFDFFLVYKEGNGGTFYSPTEQLIIVSGVSILVFLYFYIPLLIFLCIGLGRKELKK